MMTSLAPINFDEIAVELCCAENIDLSELCFATWLQSAAINDRMVRVENVAARIGLSADATARIIAMERHHVERIAQAHDFFRRWSAHEPEFRALLARLEREPEQRTWERMREKIVRFVRKGRGA